MSTTLAIPESDALIPESLREHLKQGRCVAYVGAGFSMACGMPAWDGLLRALIERAYGNIAGANAVALKTNIDKCARAVNAKEYELAASLIGRYRVLSEPEILRSIADLFGNHVLESAGSKAKVRMSLRMRNLASGPWAGIVTTNYDNLIESAIDGSGRRFEKISGDDRRLGMLMAQSSEHSFFVKIHGSIDNRPVLSTEDYDRVYLKTPRTTAFLTALMLRYHLVFIGCSLCDEITRLRRQLAMHFDGLIPEAYALLPANQENKDRLEWNEDLLQVKCILYDSGDSAHLPVDSFLEQVSSA